MFNGRNQESDFAQIDPNFLSVTFEVVVVNVLIEIIKIETIYSDESIFSLSLILSALGRIKYTIHIYVGSVRVFQWCRHSQPEIRLR